jgi:hypothetical protein
MNFWQGGSPPLGSGVKSEKRLSRMLGSGLAEATVVLALVGVVVEEPVAPSEKVVVSLSVLLVASLLLLVVVGVGLEDSEDEDSSSALFCKGIPKRCHGNDADLPPSREGCPYLGTTSRGSTGGTAPARAWDTKQTATASRTAHGVVVGRRDLGDRPCEDDEVILSLANAGASSPCTTGRGMMCLSFGVTNE